MQAKFQGSRRTEVKNLSQFFSAVGNTLMSNLAYLFLKENDEDRTVGINTGHIQTLDYNLETADKEFVIQRGYNATKAFLQYYVVQNTQTKKKPRQ
ncbi:uncharacterized protein LOC106050539 isoform X2 [Biomphalaria glabrata]|nr:uncharacterized protein LOC106050539 isoform X2 [Biomphalaria glabrata]